MLGLRRILAIQGAATPALPAPTLASVSPSATPAAGGATVTATGTNYVSGATVNVDGADVTTAFVNSTTLTFTTASHAPGAVNVYVRNPDAQTSSTQSLTYAYNPSALSLKLWGKAGGYDDGASPATWAGTASASTSGSYTLTDGGGGGGGGGTPFTETTIGGLSVADANGTTQFLTKATGQNMNGVISTTNTTVVVAFKADTAVATVANAYLAPFFFGDNAPYFGFGFDASGVRAAAYDGGWREPTAIAAATGAKHLAICTLDGTDIKISVDGSAWSSTACTGISVAGYPILIGRDYSAAKYLDAKIYEIMAGQFACDDTMRDNLWAYFQAEPWWIL